MTEVKAEQVGKEYLEALEAVLKIREERRKMYGDSFLTDEYSLLFNIIDGKRKRFSILPADQVEKKKDEIIDIINYYVFILAKLNRGDK